MKALYAGSFDPFTKGHLAVVLEIFANCDELVIGVGINPDKKFLFDASARAQLVRMSIDDCVNEYNHQLSGRKYSANEEKALDRLMNGDKISVITYSGLTVHTAVKIGANWLFRGERMVGDHDSEIALAEANNSIANIVNYPITQCFIPVPKAELTNISSSGVKMVCKEKQFILAHKYVTPSVHNEMMKIYLRKEFEGVCADFGLVNGSVIDSLFKELVEAYSAPNREYHNLSHIAYGLDLLNMVDGITGGVSRGNEVLKLAWFYHDFVNGHKSKKDEELSAKEAKKVVDRFPLKTIKRSIKSEVEKLIMATKHFEIKSLKSFDEQLISDIDLAILGDPDNFSISSQHIYQESWGWTDIKFYAQKRAEALSHLINKPQLYHLPIFAARESIAKQNMAREYAFWSNYWLSHYVKEPF
jgi:pantetheine-phosphate adenylyltransferase